MRSASRLDYVEGEVLEAIPDEEDDALDLRAEQAAQDDDEGAAESQR